MTKGFDCATRLTVTSAKALKGQGYEYTARYLGAASNWKTFDGNEAKAIQEAGLNLISIFEKSSTYSNYFTKSQGIADAKEAMAYAKAVGQPIGTAIYFTVDFDAQAGHIPAIKDYAQGVREVLSDYKFGIYGNYEVVMGLKGEVDFYWQTYAWSGGQVADHIHMHQFQNDITVVGVALDNNNVLQNPGHWQQPKKVTTYTVVAGDTLAKIAAKVGVGVDQLAKLNGLTDPNKLSIGQVLNISHVEVIKPAPSFKPRNVEVIVDALNLRDEPSTNGKIVKVLGKGRIFKAYNKSADGWYDLGANLWCYGGNGKYLKEL